MKMKKWLYGLGGLAVVATPAIAVVGCSCSCSANDTDAYGYEYSKYEYADATKTATFTIKGEQYDTIKREIDAIQPDAVRAQLLKFFFETNKVDTNIIHLSDVLKSDINEQAALRPHEISELTDATITHDATSKQIVIKAVFGATGVVTKEAAAKEIRNVVTNMEVYDGSTPVELRNHIDVIWHMVRSAVINYQ